MATSGITQPPLHAAAALEVYRHAADSPQALAFLERMYPKLVAQHAYLTSWRDPDRRGLAAIVHPWESGLDNSPAWDHLLDELEIPPSAVPPYRRFDVLHADPADRPTDAAYDRFVYLVVTYRDAGYDDARLLERSPFLIQGPLFNAIWRWSTEALAEIAGVASFGPQVFVAALHELLRAAGLRLADVDAIVLPEGNAAYFSSELQAAGMSREDYDQVQGRIVENLADVGATGSAAVLLALDAGVRTGRIRPLHTVLLVAIEASRYLYAGLSLRWGQPLAA